MFGTLGVQEMMVVFLVALVLFGPKKLPELGKTIGKALTEFRRHSNDLKATFEREMHTLERESESIHQTASSTAGEIFNHATVDQHQNRDIAPYQHWAPEPDATIQPQATVGASEVASAESHQAVEAAPAASGVIEGTVARTEAAHPETALDQLKVEHAAPEIQHG